MNKLLLTAVAMQLNTMRMRHKRKARTTEPSAMLLELQRIAEECKASTEQPNELADFNDHVKAMLDAAMTGRDITDLEEKLRAYALHTEMNQ